jgi:squalene synthase HpnC
MEGARRRERAEPAMTASAELRSGKGSTDENFPVASFLIRPRHRPAILAYYEFVRVADDIADHATLTPAEKITRLDRLEASLLGQNDKEPQGVALRGVLRTHGLSPVHAQHVLKAFRQDVTKLRYANWDELIGYCQYSAMPVGRYVLDVHGESQSTWPVSDALCAALQIINHIQDCAKDYRDLDRVYIPLDTLAANGLTVDILDQLKGTPAFKRCLNGLLDGTSALLMQSRPLAAMVRDTRLAMEIAAIQKLAERLVGVLGKHDPLSEKVHLSKTGMLLTVASAAAGALSRKLWMRAAPAVAAAN